MPQGTVPFRYEIERELNGIHGYGVRALRSEATALGPRHGENGRQFPDRADCTGRITG